MNVKEMIVTTKYGADKKWDIKKFTDDGENAQKEIHCVQGMDSENKIVTNHFQFYARDNLSPRTVAKKPENAEDIEYTINGEPYSDYVREVQIIMPLGGINSGMFRQPKVGEKVLVLVSDDNRYYLQGFIPEKIDDFSTFDKKSSIDESEGQVWRYKSSGSNYTIYPYSEIGFYTDSYERSYRNDKSKLKEKDAKEFGDPKPFDMNEIRIISTGDIKNFASERYSVLADKIILGSGGGSGDPNTTILIDDDGNVSINAKSSINLSVGRTSVSISEDGFSVNTKITESPVSNTYDASLSLRPMEGFVASGINCSIKAIKTASIGDGMGGSLSTSTGIVGLRGREIKISTYTKNEFLFFILNSSIDYLFNIMSLADGVHRRDFGSDVIHGERLEMFIKWMNFARKVFTEAYELNQTREMIAQAKATQKKYDDEMKSLMDQAETLLKKAEEKADKVDEVYANKYGEIFDLKTKDGNSINKGEESYIEQATKAVGQYGFDNYKNGEWNAGREPQYKTKDEYIQAKADQFKAGDRDAYIEREMRERYKYDDKKRDDYRAGMIDEYGLLVDPIATKMENAKTKYKQELDEWDERWTGFYSKGASKYGQQKGSSSMNWGNFNPFDG